MVFSSLPVYQFDPPNWQQQQPSGFTNEHQNPNNHFPPPLLQPPVPSQAAAQPPQPPSHAGGGAVRPNSMVERARMAKIPLPEAALKCPRCDSTNTKFCYFNNYSLTQPRHFCKTCRRYWTRGGALRNVPVGGGCRRNKRSKSNGGSGGRSKSTVVVASDHQGTTTTTTATTTTTISSGLSCYASYPNPSKLALQGIGQMSNLPILPPLQGIGDYYGLDFGGIQQLSSSSSGGVVLDAWMRPPHHQQQFPFLANTVGLEQPSSSGLLYPLQEEKALMGVKGEGDGDEEENVSRLSRDLLANININSSTSNSSDVYSSWPPSWNNHNNNNNNNATTTAHLPCFNSDNSTSHLL